MTAPLKNDRLYWVFMPDQPLAILGPYRDKKAAVDDMYRRGAEVVLGVDVTWQAVPIVEGEAR